jgi:hypothetical protein
MDFPKHFHKAHALAGTVAVPSPFPASGELFVVPKEPKPPTDRRYVKLVQIVHDQHFRTWFIDWDDIRGADVPDTSGNGNAWKFIHGAQVRADLKKHEAGAKAPEDPVYAKAIIHLHKAAPVITRHEFATAAAESIEEPTWFACNPNNDPCCPHKGC